MKDKENKVQEEIQSAEEKNDTANGDKLKAEKQPIKKIVVEETISTTSNVKDLVKQETSVLENKYLRWIISIGIAFLIFKAIDTTSEIKFLIGKQENIDKTINSLFQERNELIDGLKEDKAELELKVVSFYKLEVENERLKFEIEKLKK